jgi:glyoxylase-like metal-dependent hydrolase (beta-lactamase superfamily II)
MDQQDFNPVPGIAETLSHGLRRILAPNPSPMTFRGTNTFVLGTDRLCVIDPGPDDPAHLAALLAAIGAARVTHIIVTHSHIDHSALAPLFSRATGAPVLAFGNSLAGRSAVMASLAAQGLSGGGEGVDLALSPDLTVADGAVIEGGDWRLQVIHTPGHIGNHICLRWGNAIFAGDHVLGWSSSLVSPPEGDMGDYIRSCEKLKTEAAQVFHPAHGAPITAPAERLDALIAHRRQREAQILASLSLGPATSAALTQAIYTETPPALLSAARRNVFAHLVDLTEQKRVEPVRGLDEDAVFHLV